MGHGGRNYRPAWFVGARMRVGAFPVMLRLELNNFSSLAEGRFSGPISNLLAKGWLLRLEHSPALPLLSG